MNSCYENVRLKVLKTQGRTIAKHIYQDSTADDAECFEFESFQIALLIKTIVYQS